MVSDTSAPIYRDPTRPLEERVRDLIARMTLPEKISQMSHPARAIPRLGVPAYNYWNEALHGVARNGRATVFPQAIGMAATWDPDLVRRVASAIGDEGRAKYHEALRRNGDTGWYQGLTFWSPNVNIFRDPRWGRGQETWGEDPFLTGEMGAAFVRGLQEGDSPPGSARPKYLKAAACAKHFAVHSGPEKDRHTFNARVSLRDLHATYLPAFKKLVTEANVEAVMGAYNRTNDEPCCASQALLVDLLRGEWKFRGHVVSDCGALSDLYQNHGVTRDGAESAALALVKGCDLGCDCVYDELGKAIARGLLTEADIDRSLARTLTTRFKLGMFDPPEQVPYAATPLSVVGCAAHRALAYETALKSVVLLKNRHNALPIPADVRRIVVVGPNATNLDVLHGNYCGLNESMRTLLEGIASRVPEGISVEYRPGCALNQPATNPSDRTVMRAAEADVAIACMGLSPWLEGEESDAFLGVGGDRPDIGLPPNQVEFVKRLVAAGGNVVLVLTGGSPIALGEVADLVDAIVFVWYPGQEGGNAVADVLFGRAVPSGKLPVTFPESLAQLPPFEDYSMAGRTYRYATAEPLYPFGFGLSYTRFAYSDMRLSQEAIHPCEPLKVGVTVSNGGAVQADEVVQVYVSDLVASVPAPVCSLVAFERVCLAAGESARLEITLTPDMLMLVDEEGKPRLEPGEFRVTVGGCSPGARGVALGAPEPVSKTFTVTPHR